MERKFAQFTVGSIKSLLLHPTETVNRRGSSEYLRAIRIRAREALVRILLDVNKLGAVEGA